MKIEKVNDNQIRCTLTSEDLADRHIKLSELAYGSDKAKNLFRDMIEQANDEFGFETNDIPLMVEAIPLPSESIVLIITKVEYPEELDTRFSKFSESDEDFDAIPDAKKVPVIKGADDILDLFERLKKEAEDEAKEEQNDTATAKVSEQTDIVKMFEFGRFEEVCRMAHVLSGFYKGRNDLYKNVSENKYYLVAHKGEHTPQEFNKVCNIVSEYAYQRNYTQAAEAFFKEHGNVILKENALKVLESL